MMIESKIFYFKKKGNENLDDVIDIVIENAKQLGIKKVSVFAARFEPVRDAVENFRKNNLELIVTTYAWGTKFFSVGSEDEKPVEVMPEMATNDAANYFSQNNIPYIRGGQPLEPILSTTGDHSMEMIVESLNLISEGIPLCINSAVMAYENGFLDEGERIISFSGDTAVVIIPSDKKMLFSNALRIERILCKPL